MGIYSSPQKRFGWQQWNCAVVGCGPSTSSEGAACITTTAADLYQLTITSQLDPCATYRITDYRSVNWLNGFTNANYNTAPQQILAGNLFNPFNSNANAILSDSFFPNYVKKSSIDGNYIIAGNLKAFNGHESWGMVKSDPDGNPITSFTTYVLDPFDPAPPTSIECWDFVELADGSIITTRYTILSATLLYGPGPVKFNSDGSYDGLYNTNFLEFNGNGLAVVNQSTGKTIIGGVFTNYILNNVTGSPYLRNHMVRLNADGTEDASFYTNLGTGFNGTVRGIQVLSDDSMIVVGDFTSLNGVSAGRIVKLNADGTRDTSFDANIGAGFDDSVTDIEYYPASDSYVVCGLFQNLDGNSTDKIVRIKADGTLDSTWVGGLTYNGDLYGVTVADNDKMIIAGSYVDIDGDANEHYVSRLSADGSSYDTFLAGTGFGGTSSGVLYDPVTTGFLAWGKFMSDFDGVSIPNNITKITTENVDVPGFNAREIYTSPDLETIVIKATGPQSFEPVAYSETYGDTLDFMPYCNKIVIPLDNGLYNGVTLPDSTTLTGFNLQWDGSKAYVDMPANYPALFGHFLYIYMTFGSLGYYEFWKDPLVPGFNENQNTLWKAPWVFGERVSSSAITVIGDGVRIVFNDITEDMFNNYTTDSLYMDSMEAFGDAYGWVKRRIDTSRNIDMPFDWRGYKYRRYKVEVKPGQYDYLATKDYWYDPLGTSNSTYGYMDFSIIDPDARSFFVGGRGGTTGYWWWNGTVDNVIWSTYDASNWPGMYDVKLDFDWMSDSTLRTMRFVNLFGSSIANTYMAGVNSIMREVTGDYSNFYQTLFTSSIVNISINYWNAGYGIYPIMNYMFMDYFNVSGDFTGSGYFPTGYSKRVFSASDGNSYLEYFDGTTMQYVAQGSW